MHSTYIILATTRATEIYEVHDMLALLIASLCHDVQHTGRTNIFEVNKESLLSIIYNDKSVLENHHCAMTFKTLSDERCNIFSNIEPELRKAIRKLIIVAILGTDMAKHFGIISSCESRLRNISEEPLGSLETDKESFTEMLVHASDLAHPTKNYSVYSIWSERVC
mmetsp:Transcript_26732/g.4772  ORF Transcript_26732/g.4772 Transcript_26732/m.4772 type:complete len:166 (-) Transcript_26732:277-774(-)